MINQLRHLEKTGSRLRVGLSGAGAMGMGIASAVERTPGMELVWVSDLVSERAELAAHKGRAARFGTDTLALLQEAPVEVFVEATTAVGEAYLTTKMAVETGAHVVWMNAEADLAYGREISQLASAKGLVATSDAGDQHGVLARLLDETELWGWKTVQAGNIKGFLNEAATPESLRAEAAKRKLDPRACCAYTDGTKLAIEMALIANARGLLVPEGGMRGPRAREVSEALALFDLPAALASPEVDYLLGAEPGGGVYVIGHMDDPDEQFLLNYYKLGDGPFYLHSRACHLCHVETPFAIAQAAIERRAVLDHATQLPRNEVYAVAKRDLPAGHHLVHAIGSPDLRGELCRIQPDDQRVPIWRLHDAPGRRLAKAVKCGQVIAFQDLTEV